MAEEKTVNVKDATKNLTEEKQEKVTGAGGPRDGWKCYSCGKTFWTPPINFRCDKCGGNIGTN